MTFGITLFRLNCVIITAFERNIGGGVVLPAVPGFIKIISVMHFNIKKDGVVALHVVMPLHSTRVSHVLSVSL